MSKLRVSIVEFLNTAPLAWGLTEGPLEGRYDLSFAVPSQCAEDLRAGRVDIGVIPVIEYQRTENLVLLPDMAVAAKREVRSILVVAKRPVERVRRFALDCNSRSSTALVRLLCRNHWKIEPEFIEMEPDPGAMLHDADAALLIGDPALRVRLKVDALAGKSPGNESCCGGSDDEQPVPGVDTLFVYDVAQQWREMTGLPCVLAVWAARRGAATPRGAPPTRVEPLGDDDSRGRCARQRRRRQRGEGPSADREAGHRVGPRVDDPEHRAVG